MRRRGVAALIALLCLAALLADAAPAVGPGSRVHLPLIVREPASTPTMTATPTRIPTGTPVPNSGPTPTGTPTETAVPNSSPMPTPTTQAFGPTPPPVPTPPSGCVMSQQLIANGGFEDWPGAWTTNSSLLGVSAFRSTEVAAAGRWSLLFRNRNSGPGFHGALATQTVTIPSWVLSATVSFRWAAVVTDWAGLWVGGLYPFADTLTVYVEGVQGGQTKQLARWNEYGYGARPDAGFYGWFEVRLPLGGDVSWSSEPISVVDYRGRPLTVSLTGVFPYFDSTRFYVDEVRLDVCG